MVRTFFSYVPHLLKGPIVRILEKRKTGHLQSSILSKKVQVLQPQNEHYKVCDRHLEEVKLLSRITDFEAKGWMERHD